MIKNFIDFENELGALGYETDENYHNLFSVEDLNNIIDFLQLRIKYIKIKIMLIKNVNKEC